MLASPALVPCHFNLHTVRWPNNSSRKKLKKYVLQTETINFKERVPLNHLSTSFLYKRVICSQQSQN
ncbi:hypothetical protein S83_061547 [Arachis hypogaea]